MDLICAHCSQSMQIDWWPNWQDPDRKITLLHVGNDDCPDSLKRFKLPLVALEEF